MKRRHSREEGLTAILRMAPLELAQRFLNAATTFTPPFYPPKKEDEEEVDQLLRRHVQQLSLDSQYDILGLAQALSGLGILSGHSIPSQIQYFADELAWYAVQGTTGGSCIDDAWIQ